MKKLVNKQRMIGLMVVACLAISVLNLVAVAQVSNSSVAMPFRRFAAWFGIGEDIEHHKAGVERLTQLASIPVDDHHVYDTAGNRIHWTQGRIDEANALIQGHYDRLDGLGEGDWTYTYIPDDTTKPVVAMLSPSEGETVSGLVSVSVDATDNVAVVYVEFYVDDVLVSTDATAPYSHLWDTNGIINGSHYVYARAYDEYTYGANARRNVIVDN